MKWGRHTDVWVLALLLWGCGPPDVDFQRVSPPGTPNQILTLWQQGNSKEAIVRDGITLLEEDIALLEEANPHLPREEIIDYLFLRRQVALGLLESEWSDLEVPTHTWRRALARRHLEEEVFTRYTPDSVPLETWRQVYSDRRIFLRFDHAEEHQVIDIQMTCCRDTPHRCSDDPAVQACIQQHGPLFEEIYQHIRERNPASREEFQEVAQWIQEQYPGVGLREYGFYYDYSKPHSEQRGYFVLAESVVKAAKEAGLNRFSPPVHSFAGWHILFVQRHRPETRMAFEDPETLRILKEEFFDQVQQKYALDYLREMVETYFIRPDEETIEMTDWHQFTGFDLQLDR